MGGYNKYGKAEVNPDNPRAFAICDRCSVVTNLHKLRWQMQWNATQLFNTRLLVCADCYDKPQQQLRTIVLPPDPVPLQNVRPENYAFDNVNYRATMNGTKRITEDDSTRVPDNSTEPSDES